MIKDVIIRDGNSLLRLSHPQSLRRLNPHSPSYSKNVGYRPSISVSIPASITDCSNSVNSVAW